MAMNRSSMPPRSAPLSRGRPLVSRVGIRAKRKRTNASVLGPASDHACTRCGKRAQSWHHRVFESRLGPTDRFNCVALCGVDNSTGCHGWAHRNRAEALAERLVVLGEFRRGRYFGPDAIYARFYNGEARGDAA